ncbi:hypothetical protein CVT25_007126 [Psilocybe cyanescens]|uniref:Uncharacterized protein n=1 Tax=Psilocybe cyanescens TaxID=93625 RepID=A0A409WVT0_PSICY|nr:hypothetical protein CVT25_007126 [Psilocybe cyanescens]
MFSHCVSAIPLPDNIDYEKPSALLPRTSIYSTASFERDHINPTLSSNRRGRMHGCVALSNDDSPPMTTDTVHRYDVYHLRDLEDPVFVSAFQYPANVEATIEETVSFDDSTAGELTDSLNRIRASTDTTTWDIMALAEKQ